MLLAFDIGNSNIVIGLFDGSQLKHKWRLNSDNKKSIDDYAVDIIELCLTNKVDCLKINGCVLVSVVPAITSRIVEAIKKFLHESVIENIFIISTENLRSKIEIKIQNKNEVGHDRLINSIAGFQKFGGNLIIIDFGTATTFDIVGAQGEYLGGIIHSGVNMSLKALHEMTAQLPKISLKAQKNVIGKSTIEAMNSGAYHGCISMVEGMIKKIEDELKISTIRIITGGISEIFRNALIECATIHEPDLTLEGLRIVFEGK